MDYVLKHLFIVLGFLLAVALIARLIKEQRPPANTIAWLLSILLIPYVGVPLYFLIGGRKIRRYKDLKIAPASPEPKAVPLTNDTEILLTTVGAYAPCSGNRVEMLATGEEAYAALVSLIEEAKESISIATFIFSNDEVGKDLLERLCRRAKAGIKVRLLVDSLGCLWTARKFLNPLREAGGRVGIFLPVLPLSRRWSANLRNHRKIWIADNRLAIVGGRNIGKEYLGEKADNTRWRDFNMKVEGRAVNDLLCVFLSDWNFATNENLPFETKVAPCDDDTRLQVVPAGPDMPQDCLREGVISSILSAKQRVWIVTPYCIPDEMIAQALSFAARLGRDVRLIVPTKSNHKIADFARGSYLRQLQHAGVKCLGFDGGMVHTKLVVVDNEIGVVGSANMDMRSLYLNHEIAVFVYSQDAVHQLASHTLGLMSECRVIQLDEGKKEKARIWFEDISRLLAPLL